MRFGKNVGVYSSVFTFSVRLGNCSVNDLKHSDIHTNQEAYQLSKGLGQLPKQVNDHV